jgi:hypothetical protein
MTVDDTLSHDNLMEALEENECLLADGFDPALIGITTGINPVAVYDINRMIECLIKVEDMTPEDAREYIEYNVIGAYVGEKTPVYVDLDFGRACDINHPDEF